MRVTFTKERRRYSVLVERDRGTTLCSRAPGHDEDLPHDLLHFFAESEFGLDDGIFGALAAGRPAKLFIPVDPKETAKIWRRNRIKRVRLTDGRRSEQLAGRLERQWRARSGDPALLEKLDELAKRWRALQVGGSLTLEWPRPEGRRHHAPRKRRRPTTARR